AQRPDDEGSRGAAAASDHDAGRWHLSCVGARGTDRVAVNLPALIGMAKRHHALAARIARYRAPRPPDHKGLLARLGPGLITGASDDDPSGIAPYSQAGAQFGYAMCWVMLFCFPLMAAIQKISARIGRVTGHGIAGGIRMHYPRWL